jgi:RHS repeat-associated protein
MRSCWWSDRGLCLTGRLERRDTNPTDDTRVPSGAACACPRAGMRVQNRLKEKSPRMRVDLMLAVLANPRRIKESHRRRRRSASRVRLAGEYYDAETGLNSNGFRTRDASTWRFLQSDPLGLGGGISTYAAVDNSPLDYNDPLGLMKLPADPSGLPKGWSPDPTHRDPNGSRWRDPEGNSLDFHKGRLGKPGWRGRNHWHYNGCDDHLVEGDEVPDAAPAPEVQPDPEPESPSQPYMPVPTPAAKAITVGGVAVIVVIILLSPVGA